MRNEDIKKQLNVASKIADSMQETINNLQKCIERQKEKISELIQENANLVEEMATDRKAQFQLKAIFRDRMGLESYVEAANAARENINQ